MLMELATVLFVVLFVVFLFRLFVCFFFLCMLLLFLCLTAPSLEKAPSLSF